MTTLQFNFLFKFIRSGVAILAQGPGLEHFRCCFGTRTLCPSSRERTPPTRQMAWKNTKGVQQLIHSLEAMKALGRQLPMSRRGGHKPEQQAVTPESRLQTVVCAAESWVELPCVHLLQLWVSDHLLWLQDRPKAGRATIASTAAEEKSSVLVNEALGAVGAPTQGPRGQGAAAAGGQPQKKTNLN
eukprot:810436-Amphidinium_carterae.1